MSYPLTFFAKASANPGIKNKWNASFGEVNVEMAVPPCFEGDGGGFSPEDIYILAMLNCFIATFKVFAEKSNLSFDMILGDAILTIDLDEKKLPKISKIIVNITLYGPDHVDRAQRILKKTSENSMILNSVKNLVQLNWQIK